MTQKEFKDTLTERLANIPQSDLERTLQYYDENIGDRMEDGMSEEEAVAALGNMDDIVRSALCDRPLTTIIHERVSESHKNSSNKTLWIVLAIVGFPIWLPLVITVASVAFAIYISLWAIIVAFVAATVSLGIAAVVAVIGGIAACFINGPAVGLCAIGTGLICAALLLFLVKPIIALVRFLAKQTVRFIKYIKSLIVGKKEKNK